MAAIKKPAGPSRVSRVVNLHPITPAFSYDKPLPCALHYLKMRLAYETRNLFSIHKRDEMKGIEKASNEITCNLYIYLILPSTACRICAYVTAADAGLEPSVVPSAHSIASAALQSMV